MNETEYASQLLGQVKRFAQRHGVRVWFVAQPRAEVHLHFDGAARSFPISPEVLISRGPRECGRPWSQLDQFRRRLELRGGRDHYQATLRRSVDTISRLGVICRRHGGLCVSATC